MARAKRTDRADARRRYRAELAAQEPGGAADDGESVATAPAAPAARPGARPSGRPAPAPVSVGGAFRAAFRPLDVRGDLALLPTLLRHRAFLIPVVLTVASTVLAIATNQSLQPTSAGTAGDLLTILSVFAFQYFVVAPPVGSAFLAGFLAPRASWLIGIVVGIVAVICLAVFVYTSPAAVPQAGEQDIRPGVIAQAALVAPLGAALFAAAAAWYRRFLNLANPNRGAANQRNRGRERTRGATTRPSARRR